MSLDHEIRADYMWNDCVSEFNELQLAQCKKGNQQNCSKCSQQKVPEYLLPGRLCRYCAPIAAKGLWQEPTPHDLHKSTLRDSL